MAALAFVNRHGVLQPRVFPNLSLAPRPSLPQVITRQRHRWYGAAQGTPGPGLASRDGAGESVAGRQAPFGTVSDSAQGQNHAIPSPLRPGALILGATDLKAQAQPDTTAALAESGGAGAASAGAQTPARHPSTRCSCARPASRAACCCGSWVDEAGAVEAASVGVVSATHSRFEAPARQAMVTCRFRAREVQRSRRARDRDGTVDFRLPRS